MTSWQQEPDGFRGRIAVVAGATRGVGRGIAAAWERPAPRTFAAGAVAAVVHCCRTTSVLRRSRNRGTRDGIG